MITTTNSLSQVGLGYRVSYTIRYGRSFTLNPIPVLMVKERTELYAYIQQFEIANLGQTNDSNQQLNLIFFVDFEIMFFKISNIQNTDGVRILE